MRRMIVDLSSVIWTCLLAGKDKEFGSKAVFNGKEVLINSASYGYENAVNHLVSAMTNVGVVPRDIIFVVEGMNSKAERQAIYPAYKSNRDKPDEQYVQFNLCKEKVLDAFLRLGSQQCQQDGGIEADDVIGYLALNLEGERWILSGDKDLAWLVGQHPDIHHLRAGDKDRNPFGPFLNQFIPVWIAMVGDSSDKIPGAKGFGQAAGEKLLVTFGNDGLEAMEGLIKTRTLGRLEEDVGALKELGRIIDDQQGVYTSYELARLRIEKVNTLHRPLTWKVGMVRPRSECGDERLRKWAGVTRLVSAENYDEAMQWARAQVATSPFVTLDIETSTPLESDEWLERRGKEAKVDVFGSKLTGLSMTFGPNMRSTVYLTHGHVAESNVSNLTIQQVRDFVDLVPREKLMVVHNGAFELPICYMEWGQDWSADPEYHGFLRNVVDSAIMSSYVDENRSRGLKNLSKTLLDYEQTTYEEVTTKEYLKELWELEGRPGKLIGEFTSAGPDDDSAPGNVYVKVQHKMHELTAREVLSYGADDAICTAALTTHFRTIMEIERTWSVFMEVEQFPAYLTALAFVQGTEFSLESMAAQEKDDDAAYDAAAPILRDYLMKIGFDGSRFEPIVELTPAEVKRAVLAVLGAELGKTQVRTLTKLAKLIVMQFGDEGELLAKLISDVDLPKINTLMESKFRGEPRLDLASPKQMCELLYDRMKLPIHIINDVTPLQRAGNRDLDRAVRKFKQMRAGKRGLEMSEEESSLLRTKAKADDTAIDFALAFDTEVIDDDARAALKAIGVMKKVMTRRSLFYKNYWRTLHWKDNKLHASANQCAAVTRRYSMSDENLQQLPKKGAGVRFRSHFKPHCRDALITSIDFVGQELRLAAEKSQDKNMLACYVGDKLKDIHSITAAGAMPLKWGSTLVDELFKTHGADLSRDAEGSYDLFVRIHKTLGKAHPLTKKADDLRKEAKNVNFGAQNGARAQKLAETLVMAVEDAQLFLDAREEMFPGVAVAAEAAADKARASGCAFTFMGARRHLREAVTSDDRNAVDRAARQAWNFEIQASAGEMTKLAMARLWKRGVYFRYDARFIAPIHDELVSSVHKDHAVNFLREKNACMTEPYSTMKVPVLGSISLGRDFADQRECGDWFMEDRIQGAINALFVEKELA